MTVISTQLYDTKHIAMAPATVASEKYCERSPIVAYVRCPPSSCPNGRRFHAVASMPNHAAKTIG
jgi:hypothetical protein